ncbi:MAG: cardiolipin synthase ClsB [Burkholderiaceae bacterium]
MDPAAARRFHLDRLWLAAQSSLTQGNRVELLRNGEAFFPRLLAAIADARHWVHLETYIFDDDNIGTRVAEALADAAGRGVRVELIVDGFGTGDHARRLRERLAPLGVAVRIYRRPRWWRLDRRAMRRLHRKIAVIDDEIAFVGGINIIDDHHHPGAERGVLGPRFDYAVAVVGPLVAAVALAARRLWWLLSVARPGPEAASLPPWPRHSMRPLPGGVTASLLLRDNLRHRRTIEHEYLTALAGARNEVLIACAYFVPGRRFRAELIAAAQRGARVRLLLQGRADHPIMFHAQQALHGQLLAGGVEIYLYQPSYLHAKVAAIDDAWATVGSSNIDPYSLMLAREANVVVYDRSFAVQLAADIGAAIEHDSRQVMAAEHARRPWWIRGLNWAAYTFLRVATRLVTRGDVG